MARLLKLKQWDTANVYSNGDSERIIGRAIKEYEIPRQKLVLMTKAWGVTGEEQFAAYPIMNELRKSKDYVNQFGMIHYPFCSRLSPFHTYINSQALFLHRIGLSRISLINAVEGALARLGTTYIDLFWIHRFDPYAPIEETMETLHNLVVAGKIRYIGASSMWTYQFAMMQFCAEKHGWTKFIAMQNHYSLLYREEEREMHRFCAATGVALCPWGPLAQGNLARPISVRGSTLRSVNGGGDPSTTRKESLAIIERVQKLAEQKGWTMSQVTLAWTLRRVCSPIIGFSTVDRIDDALSARGKELSPYEEKFLEEPYTPLEIEGHY
jgi:aryl-alcohol dehydrogenase-like predicted oxidoreductase